MNATDQIFTVLVCIACGVFSGLFYDFFFCIRYFLRALWVRIVCDILFCLSFGAVYLFVSVMMELPALRLFSLFACLFGLLLYLKSFHKIVAFFAEKVYNGFKPKRKEETGCVKRKTEPKRKRFPGKKRKPKRFPRKKFVRSRSAQQ